MPYYHFLWFVTFALPSGASTLPRSTLMGAMEEFTEAAMMEDPIDYPDTDDEYVERLRTASIAMTFGWCEGGWKTDPGGDACGMPQMYPLKGEPSCEVLRTDRRVAERAMIRRMKGDVAFCGGDVKAGLGRYATGKCGWAQDLVTSRCQWSLIGCGSSIR
jgi:hypothetical protein